METTINYIVNDKRLISRHKMKLKTVKRLMPLIEDVLPAYLDEVADRYKDTFSSLTMDDKDGSVSLSKNTEITTLDDLENLFYETCNKILGDSATKEIINYVFNVVKSKDETIPTIYIMRKR